MYKGMVIRKNEYHDLVFLMRVAKRISAQEDILQAVLFMGTEKNKAFLGEIGFSEGELAAAAPGDLILAVEETKQEILTSVLENLDGWLQAEPGSGTAVAARNLDEALPRLPRANLAVISAPGAYAAREAQQALERGLNVFIFSDNIPVESERALKEYARERGLIVMGPDCGTAIIGGFGIGFANAVRRGPVGGIGASGTGLQEFTCLVHLAGSGISQAIGIGGLSMLSALDALEADSATETIALLSKPPGPLALNNLLPRLRQCRKPLIDMGADEFTTGRPHPMIDSRWRRERLLAEAKDPEVAVILLDFLLGFNSAADPVGELAPAIAEAKGGVQKRGGFLSVIASVCGTDEDHQGLRQQVARLEAEGVVVLPSSTRAARFAALLALQIKGGLSDGR